MKSVLQYLRPLRALFAACLAVLMTVSVVVPAFAAPMRNEPNAATNEAAKKYEDAARAALDTDHVAPDLKESQKMTNNGGINEIQGTIGAEDMKRPSNSGGTPTVEKQIKKALEKAQDKLD